MQVTETLNEGLKREIQVVVPAKDLETRLVERLEDAKGKVRINGFRPGKVPMQHMRKMYGKAMMAEVVNDILSKSTGSIISERGEKAAMQPEVTMTEDEKEAEKVLAGQADFSFQIAYEVIPPIEIKTVDDIKVSREVYDVEDAEIEEQMLRIAESARSFTPKKGKAEDGDRVTLDYVGKIDGEPFEGGADDGANLVIGSKQFIPGFEEQLVGTKAGDEKTITVTFPAEYQAAHLAGKEATFDVKVSEVSKPDTLELNDDLAKNLGLDSIDKLREIVKGQIESQYGALTRQKVKRQLLDALDAAYSFEAPSKLVEAEFQNIWNQVTNDLEKAGRSFEDEDTTEDEARAEYQRLAERRVRLGLVLAEIGEQASVQITDEEMQRALIETVRHYPGQEKEIYDYYRSNPQALATLRAPLFEEKVVDHLLGQVQVTDKKVSKEELLADDEDEAAEKPAKKAPAKKKAAPKKKAAAKDKEEGAE
ncbi:trigger factor [Nitratireductor sp. CAU 1489]|uniref:Trigger factor n=1 Tax=Nitratireductor arenosus TaxID=2682096 RepID=A0A844QIQ2_9HYPH|nr:trigger factor [Nitratireductor arenosus]MVA97589.1 trigger factor [Nitratireductor arenosus]